MEDEDFERLKEEIAVRRYDMDAERMKRVGFETIETTACVRGISYRLERQ